MAEGEGLPPPEYGTEDDVSGQGLLLLVLLAVVGGMVGSLKGVSWPWMLGATILACVLVAALMPGMFVAYLLSMPFTLVFFWPLGWFLMQSGKARWWAGAVLALVALAALLVQLFGGIKVITGLVIVLAAAFLCVFLSLPVLGAPHAWKHNRTGFW